MHCTLSLSCNKCSNTFFLSSLTAACVIVMPNLSSICLSHQVYLFILSFVIFLLTSFQLTMACTKMHTYYILYSPATVNKLGAISIVVGFFAKHLFISQNHDAEASLSYQQLWGKCSYSVEMPTAAYKLILSRSRMNLVKLSRGSRIHYGDNYWCLTWPFEYLSDQKTLIYKSFHLLSAM